MTKPCKAAQKAVELNPNNLGAHRLLGDIYIGTIQLSRTRTANRSLRASEGNLTARSMNSRKSSASILNGREATSCWASCTASTTRRKRLRRSTEKFLGIEPGSEDGVVALATLSMESNHNAEAIDLLNDFPQEATHFDRALEMLGDAYSSLGDTTEAANAYKRAAALNDDPELQRQARRRACTKTTGLRKPRSSTKKILQEDQANARRCSGSPRSTGVR